jgi:hypothetical protein
MISQFALTAFIAMLAGQVGATGWERDTSPIRIASIDRFDRRAPMCGV